MAKEKVKAAALVLPAGSSSVGDLTPGQYEAAIVRVQPVTDPELDPPSTIGSDGQVVPVPSSEDVYVTCRYPDGFEKDHQVSAAADLTEKIVAYVRGRFGAESVSVIRLPAALEAGESLTFEV